MRYFVATVVSMVLAAICLGDEAPATQPAAAQGPVKLAAEQRADPLSRVWVLQVDLSDPRVTVRLAPGGPDPDGPGPWQTTLMRVTDIAEREQFEWAVNASFFSVDRNEPWTGRGYVIDQPAAAVGWTATDGKQWSKREDNWPVLWIDNTATARITSTSEVRPTMRHMVAGNSYIMLDGQAKLPAEGMMTVRHPRTAVGIDREGKTLTILTVDGRQPGHSVGMTGQEMFDVLKRYNVDDAINLDGGGSTTLVHRDGASGQLQVVNRPSEARQRPVANVLGIDVKE